MIALVVIIPLFAAFLITLSGVTKYRIHWHIAGVATFFSFAASLYLLQEVFSAGRISYWFGGWEPPWGIEFVLDYFSSFILVIIAFVAFVITVYAGPSVKKEVGEERSLTFAALYMTLVAGLFGIVVTGDMFNLYVFLEIASLAGYALIGAGTKRGALVASFNYLILGTIGAVFFLLGVGYLYMVTGTLNMADLAVRLPALYDSRVILTAFALFTVGLSLKFALFPLHTWLLSAHSQAPTIISAILAAAVLKVNVYALLRVMFTVFGWEFSLQAVPVSTLMYLLAAAAIIGGSLLTIAQTNIKRMLAFSSVGQIGYIVLGIALANHTGMTGSLMHILNHALMKGGLFLAAGAVIYKTGLYELSALKGMGRKMPYSMAAFSVAGLSMVGVPLTAGFVSKWYLAGGALEAGMGVFVPVILLSSLLSATYFWRVIESIYFGVKTADTGPETKEQQGNTGEVPISMLLPVLALAGLCILFGTAAFIPLSFAERAASLLLGGM